MLSNRGERAAGRPGASVGSGRGFRRTLVALSLAAAAAPAWAADVFKGRQVYQQHCAMCHGAAGVSVMPGAPNFARNERMLQPDTLLVNAIRNGKNAMPAFAGVLTDREMFDVVAFMRTLR